MKMSFRLRAAAVSVALLITMLAAWHIATAGVGQTQAMDPEYAKLMGLTATQQGLVTARLGDPTPERGGRAKKFFTVTASGLNAVRRTQRAFTALWTGIPELKGIPGQAKVEHANDEERDACEAQQAPAEIW